MQHTDVPRITTKELNDRLGGVDLVVFDVRAEKDWGNANEKIQGAIREAPNDVEQWMWSNQKDKTMVFYCA